MEFSSSGLILNCSYISLYHILDYLQQIFIQVRDVSVKILIICVKWREGILKVIKFLSNNYYSSHDHTIFYSSRFVYHFMQKPATDIHVLVVNPHTESGWKIIHSRIVRETLHQRICKVKYLNRYEKPSTISQNFMLENCMYIYICIHSTHNII